MCNRLLVIATLLFSITGSYAQDSIRSKALPPIEVTADSPQPLKLDSLRSTRQDWELPGLTIRSSGTNAPVRVGILGAPPGGTIVKVDGVVWNDPRTGLADLTELPHWPTERIQVDAGSVSGAQGGIIDVSLLSPSKWAGWKANVGLSSEREQSEEFAISGGERYPIGVSIAHNKHERGSFPAYNEFHRDRFVGSETTNLYFCSQLPIARKNPVVLSLQYRNHRNDLPGLVWRAVETLTEETKTGINLALSYHGPVKIHGMVGTNKTTFTRPASQPSPLGPTPFFPADEQSEWRGASLVSDYQHRLWFDQIRYRSSFSLDWVRFTDHYQAPGSQAWIVQRNSGSITVSATKTISRNRFMPWIAGRFQGDCGCWQPSRVTVTRGTGELSSGFSPYQGVQVSVRGGSALRWATFNEMFLAPNVFVAGNPELKPENSRELQGNVSWQPDPRFSVAMLVYGRETENGVVWRQNSRGQFVPRNLLRSISTGGIVKTQLNPTDHFSLELSAAKTDSRNDTDGDINYGKRMPLIPLYQAQSQVTYRTTWKQLGINVSPRWFYQSRRYLLQSNTDPLTVQGNDLPDESVLDLSSSIDFPASWFSIATNFQIGFSVRNTFNRQRWALEGVPLPGRYYELSCTWSKKLEVLR